MKAFSGPEINHRSFTFPDLFLSAACGSGRKKGKKRKKKREGNRGRTFSGEEGNEPSSSSFRSLQY